MWTQEGTYEYAEFDGFSVASEDDSYTLTLTNYRAGSAGPGGLVTYHSGKPFSTADRDNARNCSYIENVAWWFLDEEDIVLDASEDMPEGLEIMPGGLEGKSWFIVL